MLIISKKIASSFTPDAIFWFFPLSDNIFLIKREEKEIAAQNKTAVLRKIVSSPEDGFLFVFVSLEREGSERREIPD